MERKKLIKNSEISEVQVNVENTKSKTNLFNTALRFRPHMTFLVTFRYLF